MSKVHVFNAGPCILPQQAIDNSIEALKDFKGTGISVLSVSHRSKEWGEVMDEVRAIWKELLNIPDTHEVVFLGGGASLQFLYVAMNFLENKAAYLDHEPAGRCQQVCYDLWWCPEERRPCRCDIRNHPQGCSRKGKQIYPYNA